MSTKSRTTLRRAEIAALSDLAAQDMNKWFHALEKDLTVEGREGAEHAYKAATERNRSPCRDSAR